MEAAALWGAMIEAISHKRRCKIRKLFRLPTSISTNEALLATNLQYPKFRPEINDDKVRSLEPFQYFVKSAAGTETEIRGKDD